MNMSNIIVAEGDTGVAVFTCACCHRRFRAYMDSVVTANKQPVCLACVDDAQPKRAKLGLPPIPVVRSAYLTNG